MKPEQGVGSAPSPPKRLDVRRRERDGGSRKYGSQKNSRKKKERRGGTAGPGARSPNSTCSRQAFFPCLLWPASSHAARSKKKYCMLEPEPWASSLRGRRLTHSATRAPARGFVTCRAPFLMARTRATGSTFSQLDVGMLEPYDTCGICQVCTSGT